MKDKPPVKDQAAEADRVLRKMWEQAVVVARERLGATHEARVAGLGQTSVRSVDMGDGD